MLKTLEIENIAVIERAEIEFLPGFNVLTGETGAGKSIVVDSINAILGERTSRELVRTGAQHAFVSAYFTDIDPCVSAKLEELGYPKNEENDLIITRRIGADGKSLCKINSRTANVSALKELGKELVNIHGQHDSQALLNPESHIGFIDMLCKSDKPLCEYKEAFSDFMRIRRRLKRLTADAENNDNAASLLDYQIAELENAGVSSGETERLTERKKALDNAADALSALSALDSCVNGDDDAPGVRIALSTAAKELEPFALFLPDVEKLLRILADTDAQLEDALSLSRAAAQQLDSDPEEKEAVEDRLDLLFRLSSKYGGSEERMLEYLESARKKRALIATDEQELERLDSEYDAALQRVSELAARLSNERKAAAAEFEKNVKRQLEFLDMPGVAFKVDFQKGILSSSGTDRIEFLISANAGEEPRPLARIASGGELSRIMLAIKSILAYNDTIDTLIFDEIDTGVSGRASGRIGQKLKSLSKDTQVITVTHSAQIASFADSHFLIKKDTENGRTYSNITPLSKSQRIEELARIMGGLNITDALLNSAAELLNTSQEANGYGHIRGAARTRTYRAGHQ